MNVLVIDSAEVLTTLGKSDTLRILLLIVYPELFETWVKDMVETELIV